MAALSFRFLNQIPNGLHGKINRSNFIRADDSNSDRVIHTFQRGSRRNGQSLAAAAFRSALIWNRLLRKIFHILYPSLPFLQNNNYCKRVPIFWRRGNFPFMGLGNRFCDGKANPVSPCFRVPGGVGSVKSIKQTWQIFCFHRLCCIKYADNNIFPAFFRTPVPGWIDLPQ